MPAFAAIDVGSNAMRLAIGRMNGQVKLEVIAELREPVRLGQDVFTMGELSDETCRLTVDAFVKFRKLIDRHGAEWVRAVGTSAMREASNREGLIEWIARETGIGIEVISGEEEAHLVSLAVSDKVGRHDDVGLLIDIGGGSVEVSIVAMREDTTSRSLKLGTVRMLQVLADPAWGNRGFRALVERSVADLKPWLDGALAGRSIAWCVGTEAMSSPSPIWPARVLPAEESRLLSQRKTSTT